MEVANTAIQLDLGLGSGRILANLGIACGSGNHASQVMRRRHIIARQPGRLLETRVVHAQGLRLLVHGLHEGRQATRIVAPERIGGTIFRGHQRQQHGRFAGHGRSHRQP
ncbi:hypothetical protein SDC9_209286 [bioreactor metagenome]|uniref:Uncharacterized protein n=1 Tax=bioreactor metagenome TaxID=1076179 RepID=A0A645JCX3_9ZZZZ